MAQSAYQGTSRKGRHKTVFSSMPCSCIYYAKLSYIAVILSCPLRVSWLTDSIPSLHSPIQIHSELFSEAAPRAAHAQWSQIQGFTVSLAAVFPSRNINKLTVGQNNTLTTTGIKSWPSIFAIPSKEWIWSYLCQQSSIQLALKSRVGPNVAIINYCLNYHFFI